MWLWILYLLSLLIVIKLFNKLTTTKCYADTVMSGKVVIVTGANSGIGYETALELAKRGAKVILACRDDHKGIDTEKRIRKLSKKNSVRYMNLDLSRLASIRSFVDNFKSTEAKLDVLINNAGASGLGRCKTSDGIVKDMQINHFGPFLLTILLVPILKKSAPSRVINVSSILHRMGTVEHLNEENYYNYIQTYANSKLCNVLFSNELARRLEGTGVTVNSMHPGYVITCPSKSTLIEKLRSLILYTISKSPEEGAQTAIYLAISDDCDQMSGRYYAECREGTMSGKAKDINLMARLWALSEELVQLQPNEMI